MVSFKQILAIAACAAVSFAQVPVEDVSAEVPDIDNAEAAAAPEAPVLKVDVTTTFPEAEIFGVKLVNGRPTRALFNVVNNEAEPVSILYAIGALVADGTAETPEILRNLTTIRYSTTIPAGSSEVVSYSFSTIMHPRDVTLDLKVLVQAGDNVFSLPAFRESVSVVEAPVSIFDPQIIFLYLVLAGAFGGTIYAIYAVWIKDLLPQNKRKSGDRSKRSVTISKNVDEAVSTGTNAPAANGKGYDESWIPAGHINKPAAKKVGGRTPKSKAT